MGLVSTTIPNLIGGVSQQPYVVRMASQCETMLNAYPSVVEFLRRRPASRHVAHILSKKVSDAAVHVIDRDSTEQYVVVAADNDLMVFDLNGQKKTVNFVAAKSYLATTKPNTDLAFLTINDYTFILNKKITAKASTAVTAKRTPEALVFIKQASYATDYSITLDGTTFTHTTYKDDNRRSRDGLEYTEKNGFNMDNTALMDSERYKLSSSIIAADLRNKINAGGVYTCSLKKNTLWIRLVNGGTFVSSVSDSRSNTHISMATDRVQRFSDLPIVAPNGYTVEITGDQSSSFDNYFVKFETDNGSSFDSGVWVETVKPGITYKLNQATLPHALVREADGTFTVRTLEWGDRVCGDLKSAPDPSFLNRKISSVFFYRNRLGFLSGSNCVMSEAGEFFNFFRTTVTAMVDSDPIDVAASHTKAVNLYHATAFSEGLLLFSDQTQFLLEHDDVFSGETTSIAPTTEFECSIKAVPIGAGKNIFFATSHGEWGGIREYFVEEDVNLTDAVDITSHVPHYIKGEIQKLVVSTNENSLLALTSQNRQRVTLYRYFWNGREKLLSSWSEWKFSGEVLSAAFLGSSLLLIMQYADGVYLETMNTEPGYVDTNTAYEISLDRKIAESSISTFVYDADMNQTTITFPYTLTTAPTVVSRNTTSASGVESDIYKVISYSGSKAIVEGDLRSVVFFAGIPFRFLYEFSPQILREDTSNGKVAVMEGRLQLRSFSLNYSKTGYFEAHITPEYRDTDVRIFGGRILGHGANILGRPAIATGTFRLPVLSNAETVKIQIISDSFLPCQITSAGWEGYFNLRSRRV